MAESVLDLRAVEERSRDARLAKQDVAPLLAHVRALRAALIEARWDIGSRDVAPCWCDAGLEPQEAQPHSMRCNRITAVLRGAQDQEGEPDK